MLVFVDLILEILAQEHCNAQCVFKFKGKKKSSKHLVLGPGCLKKPFYKVSKTNPLGLVIL